MTTIHRRPQFQAPIYNLPSARVAEREDDQMPAENLSELLGQYQKIRRAKLMISLVTLDGSGKSCGGNSEMIHSHRFIACHGTSSISAFKGSSPYNDFGTH